MCDNTFHRIEDMILADNRTQHQTEIEGKLKLELGSELRKEYMTMKTTKSEEDKMYLLIEVVNVWR